MIEIILLPIILILIFTIGFLTGTWIEKRKRQKRSKGKRIEEYSFYPFIKNKEGHIEFSQDLFTSGVRYFLANKDQLAAQQLIIIGEQNLVRETLGSTELSEYKKLYKVFNGHSIINDNNEYLENFKRIVKLIGKSFSGTGIEILLHNLVNPSRSIVAIENGEVTGRQIENGTTNLVLDLKTRKENNQDKLNYELNIGSRKFKCTTIPIFRKDFGLVGAICLNVDVNFIRDYVATDPARLTAFIDNLLKADFELNENILSKDEFRKSISGKKHFLDNPMLITDKNNNDRGIFVIMFSDIVNYTSLMGLNEKIALEILAHNRSNHVRNIRKFKGEFLKEMGDGILSSFTSVSNAVQCAVSLQNSLTDNDNYKLRIGIHLGEVIKSNSDIIGDGVNIASRIQEEASPGEIIVSEVIYQNLKNKQENKLTYIGEKELKNVENKIKLYKINSKKTV
jgi:class 3 adenylate cyclase/predicted transcriptional regulator YheO